MAADGSDLRQVTGGYNDADPSWSPAADRIAFWGSRPEGQALYTVRSDGIDVTLLAPQSLRPASPAWVLTSKPLSSAVTGPAAATARSCASRPTAADWCC